jgi:hypothetical protein
LKSDGQDSNFLCEKDCKFRAKEIEFGPGVSGSGKDSFINPVDLEREMSAEERIESGNAMARERQAQDETKRKTGSSTNPRDDPNQVRVTLTTLRDAQGRITGSSTARSLMVPANLDMNPPDLTALTTGDEEYLLVRVSKEQKKCWVTYLNGEDPDSEQEFYWGMSVSYLVERDRATSAGPRPRSPPAAESMDLPNPTRLAQVQKGEMRGYERSVKLKQGTRESTHTRFRRQASESGGERCVPRDAPRDNAISLARRLPLQREDLSSLTHPFGESPSGEGLLQSAASESVGKGTTRRRLKESCKTISPSSPDTTQSPLFLRTQWMREDDPRTEEQADADWRRVTESIFGANTGAAPKVVEEKIGVMKNSGLIGAATSLRN